jgi:hypothetical protein
MEANDIHALGIDVRRLLTFGVIKGFLRRSHCYPIWLDHPSFAETSTPATVVVTEATPRSKRTASARYPPSLPMLLDGQRHTDELCLRFKLSFAQLLGHFRAIGTQRPDLVDWGLRGLGRVQLIYM